MRTFRGKPLTFSGLEMGFVFGILVIATAGLLQACGGGSSSTVTTSPTTPTPTPTPMPTPPPFTVTANATTYSTLGAPFQAAPTSSGIVLVSVNADNTSSSTTGVQVFTPASGGGLQSACVNPLPSSLLGSGTLFANLRLLPNGTALGGGIGSLGAIFYNLAALKSCSDSGVAISQGEASSNQGTLDVVVTPDEKFAFVENESGIAPGATTRGNIGVVALQMDTNGNVTTGSTLIGQIASGGNTIAGMKLSPDGTRLYVTSEVIAPSTVAAGATNPILAKTGCVQQPGTSSRNGLLTVMNVATAETTPGPAAIVSIVDAGCSPVRMAEASDKSTLWVSARGDNRVLAFSPAMLESNPDNALLGFADTGGTAPVGVSLFHNDQLLAVANSNRFNTGIANATILYVANPASASVVDTIPTGLFPREVNTGPDDATLYLTNFDSDTLEVISTIVK